MLSACAARGGSPVQLGHSLCRNRERTAHSSGAGRKDALNSPTECRYCSHWQSETSVRRPGIFKAINADPKPFSRGPKRGVSWMLCKVLSAGLRSECLWLSTEAERARCDKLLCEGYAETSCECSSEGSGPGAGVRPCPAASSGPAADCATRGVSDQPHLTARANALDTTPAMFRTVLAESGRGDFVHRWCPLTGDSDTNDHISP